jgi:hypothetical protein
MVTKSKFNLIISVIQVSIMQEKNDGLQMKLEISPIGTPHLSSLTSLKG